MLLVLLVLLWPCRERQLRFLGGIERGRLPWVVAEE